MSRTQKTLAAVFEEPARANIAWKEIEMMLRALGAEMSQGAGSRMRFTLNGVRAVLHRPHPEKEAGKGTVRCRERLSDQRRGAAMTNTLTYKGYTGHVEFDAEQNILFGRVLGLRDVITFQAASAKDVRKAFRDSVDDYLAYCRERGESPESSKSGRFNVRVDPLTHRYIELAARRSGLSLNKWVEKHLREDAEREVKNDSKP